MRLLWPATGNQNDSKARGGEESSEGRSGWMVEEDNVEEMGRKKGSWLEFLTCFPYKVDAGSSRFALDFCSVEGISISLLCFR